MIYIFPHLIITSDGKVLIESLPVYNGTECFSNIPVNLMATSSGINLNITVRQVLPQTLVSYHLQEWESQHLSVFL